jgi:hypothetical protein
VRTASIRVIGSEKMRRFTLGEVKEMTNTPNEWLD